VGADEGLDDDGPEFRAPLSPEDRVWRHPSELRFTREPAAPPPPATGRSPWTIGLVSALGGVLLAGSLMFTAGGVGDEPGQIALRPLATLAPRSDAGRTERIASLDVPEAPASLVGVDVFTGSASRSGNGLVVQAPGYVVTTATLVAGAIDIHVVDAAGVIHAGIALGADEVNDVAIVHVPGLATPVATLDRNATTTTGDDVFVMSASRGAVAGSRTLPVSSTDARLTSGNCDLHGGIRMEGTLDVSAAGAPVLSSSGAILGLVTTRLPDQDAIAIPVRTVAWAAEQLVDAGRVEHGWLGVEGVTAGDGALVSRVLEASPAQSAGVQPDDVVVALDGETVTSMSELVVAVRERTPGTTVTVGLLREGTRQDIPVALAEPPLPPA
jgi:putative serine protease PepD